MLNSTHNWSTYFLNKPVVENCNVKIYDDNGTLLYDKGDILSFKITSRNCGVCNKVPSDDCYVVFDSQHSFTKNDVLRITYTMGNEETTTCKVLIVDTYFYNTKSNKTELHLVSPFMLATDKEVFYPNLTVAESMQLKAISKACAIRLSSIALGDTFSYNNNTRIKYPRA